MVKLQHWQIRGYALIELPMYQELPQEVVQKMLEPVRKRGLKVVIAHPERYTYIQRNPKKILEYFDDEIIFQSNYGSIIGAYGRDAQKTIKKLLKDYKKANGPFNILEIEDSKNTRIVIKI